MSTSQPLGPAVPMADASQVFPNWAYRCNNYETMCETIAGLAWRTKNQIDHGRKVTVQEIKLVLQAIEDFANRSKADARINDLAQGQRMIMDEIKRGNQTEDEHYIQLKNQVDELTL